MLHSLHRFFFVIFFFLQGILLYSNCAVHLYALIRFKVKLVEFIAANFYGFWWLYYSLPIGCKRSTAFANYCKTKVLFSSR
jgi:hypothetical protein